MIVDIDKFLDAQTKMSIACSTTPGLLLKGKFRFYSILPGCPEVEDAYELEILVPENYPCMLPKVVETGKRIPRDNRHHINAKDDTLCLGSPIRIHNILLEDQTLCGFAEKILTPFLYAMSLKLNFQIDFIFGELKHGREGIFQDYMDLFGLCNKEQVLAALKLLVLQQSAANEMTCPCGCNRRLGRCAFRRKLKKFRNKIDQKAIISELEFLKDSRN